MILTGNINKDGSIVMKNSSFSGKDDRNFSENASSYNNSYVNKTHSNVLRVNSQM